MNINKAIKKQDKSVKRFLLFMSFIFLMLVITMIFTHSYQKFLLIYLLIIETIIISAILTTINYYKISYAQKGYKISVNQGLFNDRVVIQGDKVVLVGLEEDDKDFQIIIISYVKIRGKNSKKVNREFLIKHGYISSYYLNLIKKNNNDSYYYIILKKGGLKKYPLLNSIYKSCVYAEYTEWAIEKIKEYRQGIK